jgi:hypothetical protein
MLGTNYLYRCRRGRDRIVVPGQINPNFFLPNTIKGIQAVRIEFFCLYQKLPIFDVLY